MDTIKKKFHSTNLQNNLIKELHRFICTRLKILPIHISNLQINLIIKMKLPDYKMPRWFYGQLYCVYGQPVKLNADTGTPLSFGEQNILKCHQYNYLGVQLDECVNMTANFDNIFKKNLLVKSVNTWTKKQEFWYISK